MGARHESVITCTGCGKRHVQVSYLGLCGGCLHDQYGPGGFERHTRPPHLNERQQSDRDQRRREVALTGLVMANVGHARQIILADEPCPVVKALSPVEDLLERARQAVGRSREMCARHARIRAGIEPRAVREPVPAGHGARAPGSPSG